MLHRATRALGPGPTATSCRRASRRCAPRSPTAGRTTGGRPREARGPRSRRNSRADTCCDCRTPRHVDAARESRRTLGTRRAACRSAASRRASTATGCHGAIGTPSIVASRSPPPIAMSADVVERERWADERRLERCGAVVVADEQVRHAERDAVHGAAGGNPFALVRRPAEVLHRRLQPGADDANAHSCQLRNSTGVIGRKRTRSPAASSVAGSRVMSKIASGVRPIRFHPPGDTSG